MRTLDKAFTLNKVGSLLLAILLLGCGGASGQGGNDWLREEAFEEAWEEKGNLEDENQEDLVQADEAWPYVPDTLEEAPEFGQDHSEPGNEKTGTTALFDPDSPGLFDMPFPTDALSIGGGDLFRFPNPLGVPMLDQILSLATAVLDGYSVVPVVYFAFDGPISEASFTDKVILPSDSEVVQLVDVTQGPDFGTRVPLLWRYRDEGGTYLPKHLLSVRPLWGFTLKEGHSYAAIVLDSLLDASLSPLVPSPKFVQALDGSLHGHDRLISSLEPLRKLLEAEPKLKGHIVVGTVFTCARPTLELRRIRDYIREDLEAPVVTDLKPVAQTQDYYRYEGHYVAPSFLSGDPPYLEKGSFVFDASGKPVVQRWEKMRFVLIVPRGLPMPPSGWPVVLHSHGTGGQYDSHVENPGRYLARAGLAGIGIDQPLHGERVDPPLSETELALYSFNFLNLEAGRTVQRQSIADNIVLIEMLRAHRFRVPAEVSYSGHEERFDPEKILFFGHSQGGLTGAMLFGVEDRLLGGVLSGAGGGLSLTLMLRKDFMDIAEMIRGFAGIEDPSELTEDHPIIQLIQMVVDATDPISYAPFYFSFDKTEAGTRPRNVLMTEGLLDEQTPPATTEALAATAGVPVLEPVVHWPEGLTFKGLLPLVPPVVGNIEAQGGVKATAVLAQFQEGDHFTVFYDSTARQYYLEFMSTLASDGIATVSGK